MFHKLYNYPNLYLNGTQLTQVDYHSHLGLVLNSKMTWSHHIEQVSSKAWKRLHALKRTRHMVPKNAALNIYKSMIRPTVEYGGVIYDNSGQQLHI